MSQDIWIQSIWSGRKGVGVESTGPGGVESGGAINCVGSGVVGLEEDFPMLAGHNVEVVERSVDVQIVKAGGVMSSLLT